MPNAPTPSASAPRTATLRTAVALALGAGISLGLARFAYALLLPAMRADLGWSYVTAGAMNTANAAGYLIGALLMPAVLARASARSALVAGGAGAALGLAGHALAGSDAVLVALRVVLGIASAATFVAGGVLAARLAQQQGAGTEARDRAVPAGLVLGIYYGGTGLGIVASALLVPLWTDHAAAPGTWRGAWWALAACAAMATGLMARGTRPLQAPASGPTVPGEHFRWRPLGFGLAGYLMFGLGYIGYMTFIISLLREQGLSGTQRTAFFTMLGLGVMASSWLWARLLQRHRNGRPMALLNGLLALATVLPVWSVHPAVIFLSGVLFGSVFLSVVASTTALVRHNVPQPAWAGGIAAFTIVFAAGQIVGPTLVGWVADGGGLLRGFAVSAALLALGSLIALGQRAKTD